MAISLNEICTQIAMSLGGKRMFDTPLKLAIADKVDQWRARLIRDTIEKNGYFQRRFFRQSLIIKMKRQSQVICPVPMEVCDIAVSIDPVPQIIRANNISFDFVGSVDGMKPLQESFAGGIQYMNAQKYSGPNFSRYTWDNSYIKVFGNPNLPVIRVDGIFQKPLEVYQLGCNDENCDYWDSDYPCPLDLVQLIVQSILTVDYNRLTIADSVDTQVSNDNDLVEPTKNNRG